MGLDQVLRCVGFATGSALTATLLGAATPERDGVPASGGSTAIGLLACPVALVTAAVTAALPRRPAAEVPAVPDAPVTGR